MVHGLILHINYFILQPWTKSIEANVKSATILAIFTSTAFKGIIFGAKIMLKCYA